MPASERRSAPQVVSKFGVVDGITRLGDKTRLELLPYATTGLDRMPVDAGDPLNRTNNWRRGVGLDLKYGLGPAFTLSATINPDGLHHQNAGAIYQAIGGALFESILFSGGRLLNPHFRDYRLPRFSDMPPQIDVILVNRKDLPSAGAGETGIVGLAPAVGNAIFAATGQRLRNMPMAPTTAIPGIPQSPFRA